jgi:hypothetical protein
MSAERIGYLNPDRGYFRVKTGFSWPAFFFGGLWAIAKGLWLVALGMLALDILIWFCSGFAEAKGNGLLAFVALALQIAYWVFRGREGNGWWRAKLLRQGYKPVDAKQRDTHPVRSDDLT